MADYYPLLKRAVAALPENTPETRQAIFLRAKTALTSQLRSVDPPLSEGEIARERLALDDVIRRIEAEERDAFSQREAFAQRQAPSQWQAEAPAAGHAWGNDGQPQPGIAHDEAFVDNEPRPDEPGEADGPPSSGGRRPRLDPVRRRGDGRGLRRAIVFGVLGLLILAIAGLAYWVNKINQPDVPGLAQAPPAAPPANAERKFNERVGGDQPPPATAPPASTQPSAPAPRPGTRVAPAIGVAQRAILYEESPDNPQAPRALAGRVVWRLDTINPGQGQPLETVVRALIDVPEAGLSLAIVFRRNNDPVLPASHTMEMTFSKLPGSEGRVIRDIGVPQFKVDESARGAPLSGLPVPVTDTLFLVGLSKVPTDVERNLELMRTRNWIDIPIRYVNGRRAVLAFEKGVSGDQVLNDALKAWQ